MGTNLEKQDWDGFGLDVCSGGKYWEKYANCRWSWQAGDEEEDLNEVNRSCEGGHAEGCDTGGSSG